MAAAAEEEEQQQQQQQQQVQEEVEEELPRRTTPVVCELHRTTQVFQLENGLRHGDFLQYRHFLTRKLARLRKQLQFTLSEGSGRGRRYKEGGREVTASEVVRDERFLLLPLLDAERAWSQAMDLKQSDREKERERMERGVGISKLRNHRLQKFNRAAKWAAQLQTLAEDERCMCDENTKRETAAYAAWMRGNFLLEREDWQDALQAYLLAQQIYMTLSSTEHGASLEQQDLFQQRCAELEPVMRYCTFAMEGGDDAATMLELRGTSDLLQSKLEDLMAKNAAKQAADTDKIEWLGREVPVHSNKTRAALVEARREVTALRKALEQQASARSLAKLHGADGAGTGAGAGADGDAAAVADVEDAYIRSLTALDEAKRAASTELSELDAMTSGTLVESHREDVTILASYLEFQKHILMVERTDNMLNRLRPQVQIWAPTTDSQQQQQHQHDDTVRPHQMYQLLENMLQSLDVLRKLEGVEEADEVTIALQAKTAVARTERIVYLAEAYASERKLVQALALHDYADELAREAAQEDYLTLDMGYGELDADSLGGGEEDDDGEDEAATELNAERREAEEAEEPLDESIPVALLSQPKLRRHLGRVMKRSSGGRCRVQALATLWALGSKNASADAGADDAGAQAEAEADEDALRNLANELAAVTMESEPAAFRPPSSLLTAPGMWRTVPTSSSSAAGAAGGGVDGIPAVYALPPALEVVACKPVVFDLALNLMEYPAVQGQQKEQQDKSSAARPAGAASSGADGTGATGDAATEGSGTGIVGAAGAVASLLGWGWGSKKK